MNKINMITLLLSFSLATMLYSQEYSNYKGSNYKFKKFHLYEASDVESQGKTGTCWSFSSLSFFESEMRRKSKMMKNRLETIPNLSEMYIVRKAYEMKAEKYIRMDGKTNFAEGGAFHDIPLVIREQGIVPKSAYTGKAEDGTYDHGEMYGKLNEYLESIIKNELGNENGIRSDWKDGFNQILDQYLGEVPKYVMNDSGKKVTPKDYASMLNLDMNDYVSLTSFSNHPFFETCRLEIPDNWAWGKSYNIPLEQLYEVATYALDHGYTMAWGADVSEKGFNFRKGLAIVPASFNDIEVIGKDNKNYNNEGANKEGDVFLSPSKELKISQDLRQLAYDNKTTTDDHGMHITGLFEDQNGTKYFYVKNSWGKKNYPEGYLFVSESYFKYKTINIFLHKEAIPQELRDKLKL